MTQKICTLGSPSCCPLNQVQAKSADVSIVVILLTACATPPGPPPRPGRAGGMWGGRCQSTPWLWVSLVQFFFFTSMIPVASFTILNPVAGFTALGEMAMALSKVGAQPVMGPLLPRVADQIKEAISVKGRARPNCPEALQCVGVLAQALGPVWKAEATSLVAPMMSTGLSQPLVKTLQVTPPQLSVPFPPLFPNIVQLVQVPRMRS